MYLSSESKDKLATIKMDKDTMGKICLHVASGGSLISLCEAWGVPYAHVMGWVNSDESRWEMYQKAMKSQMEYVIDEVIRELKRIGNVDISKAYNNKGTLLPITEMPEEVRRCISGIETAEIYEGVGDSREIIGHTKKLRVFDKLKALEMIGKKFAMWIDRTQLSMDKSLEDLIAESMGDGPIVDAVEVKDTSAQIISSDGAVCVDKDNRLLVKCPDCGKEEELEGEEVNRRLEAGE